MSAPGDVDRRVARRSVYTTGDGYVFWNPDSGEEYSADHPVQAGICEDAERIRHSTGQEDCLHAAVQAHWHAAEAARQERDQACDRLAAVEVERDALALAVKTARADAIEAAARIVETEPAEVECDRFAFNGHAVSNAAGHDLFISTQRASEMLRRCSTAIRALPRSPS